MESNFSELQVVQWGAAWIDIPFRHPLPPRDRYQPPPCTPATVVATACAPSLPRQLTFDLVQTLSRD